MKAPGNSDHEHAMWISDPHAGLARILRFISVGGASSVLYFILAAGITFAVPGHELFASITAYCACIGFSFVLQRNFAFRSTGKVKFELIRFAVVSVIGLVLSTVIVFVAVSKFDIPALGSYVIVIATIPVISYILFSRFVFHR